MLALTGQAWDRETLQGNQRAARTQPEPLSWADCPYDTWADLSGPQAQKGLPLHPWADLSGLQAQRGGANPRAMQTARGTHGQISVGPRPRAGLPHHPWRFWSDSPCTLLTPGFKAKTHWKHSVPTSETAAAHEGGHTHSWVGRILRVCVSP